MRTAQRLDEGRGEAQPLTDASGHLLGPVKIIYGFSVALSAFLHFLFSSVDSFEDESCEM